MRKTITQSGIEVQTMRNFGVFLWEQTLSSIVETALAITSCVVCKWFHGVRALSEELNAHHHENNRQVVLLLCNFTDLFDIDLPDEAWDSMTHRVG